MDLQKIADALRARTSATVEVDRPLAPLTTYRVGGPAALYVEPSKVEDLAELGRLLGEDGGDVPVLSLGRGSNMVVSDDGFPGIVIRLGAAFSRVDGDGETGMRVGAGTPMPTVANWAARRGLSGVEFMVAIPGAVGGGVKMNAGAHGGDVATTLRTVVLFDLDRGVVETRDSDTLGLRYRASDISDRHLILEATFDLTKESVEDVRARMESYRRHRAETQPGALQNAGSTFKNPSGDHAGRLVEAAGLKGFRVGGASVSTLHANFFMASEEATAQDVYDLVHEVRARVRDAFGVDLQPEVRFIGSFKGRSFGGPSEAAPLCREDRGGAQ